MQEENKLEDWEKIIRVKVLKSEYDGGRDTIVPILPPREGYVIDYDDESGWPYYITVEEAARRKLAYEKIMEPFKKMIKGDLRKGIFEIFSTPADVKSTGEDFRKLWQDVNNL